MQHHKLSHKDILAKERLIAHYIARIIPDLKLINASDYIKYIYNKRFANIQDIIEAATELHFIPNSVKFANEADCDINWDSTPIISLALIFNNLDIQASFYLIFSKNKFSIKIKNISCHRFIADQKLVEEKLRLAFNDALLSKHKQYN